MNRRNGTARQTVQNCSSLLTSTSTYTLILDLAYHCFAIFDCLMYVPLHCTLKQNSFWSKSTCIRIWDSESWWLLWDTKTLSVLCLRHEDSNILFRKMRVWDTDGSFKYCTETLWHWYSQTLRLWLFGPKAIICALTYFVLPIRNK